MNITRIWVKHHPQFNLFTYKLDQQKESNRYPQIMTTSLLLLFAVKYQLHWRISLWMDRIKELIAEVLVLKIGYRQIKFISSKIDLKQLLMMSLLALWDQNFQELFHRVL